MTKYSLFLKSPDKGKLSSLDSKEEGKKKQKYMPGAGKKEGVIQLEDDINGVVDGEGLYPTRFLHREPSPF